MGGDEPVARAWTLAKDVIQQFIVPRALESYQQANEFLVDSGVLPHIDLRARVNRRREPQADRPDPRTRRKPAPAGGMAERHGPMADSFFTPAR